MALEQGFLHGATRFTEPGRGHGLDEVRRTVADWGGQMSIWSGKARITTPLRSEEPVLETTLPPLGGSQIVITLPWRG